MDKIVQTASAGIAGAIGYCLGEVNGLLIALLVFMILDYITGVIIAIMEKKLSSDIGFKGLCKKLFILVLVAVGHIIDSQVIGHGSTCKSIIISFYMANEGLSILENIGKFIDYPPKLREILIQLRGKSENGEGIVVTKSIEDKEDKNE